MELSPVVWAERGMVLEVAGAPGSGVTSVLLAFLAPLSVDAPVAYLDVRGTVSPVAAAESGCVLERLAFVRAAEPDGWARSLAYLLDGVRAVAAEAPPGAPDGALRALAARARARRRLLALAPVGHAWRLPAGLASGRLELLESRWSGLHEGRGSLAERRIRARLEGKLARGGAIDGVLDLPSLDLVPLAGEAAAGRHLVAVR